MCDQCEKVRAGWNQDSLQLVKDGLMALGRDFASFSDQLRPEVALDLENKLAERLTVLKALLIIVCQANDAEIAKVKANQTSEAVPTLDLTKEKMN